MIVIDIDQDFFYDPPLFDEDFRSNNRKEQKQVIDVKSFIKKYSLFNKNYTIFRDHHQAYHYIKQIGKIDKLLHFDAHYDFHGMDDDKEELSIGNWVKFLLKDGLCNDVDWIASNKSIFNNDPAYLSTKRKTINNIEYQETFFDYESHKWIGNIDHVLFTVSREFCPDLNALNEFIRGME